MCKFAGRALLQRTRILIRQTKKHALFTYHSLLDANVAMESGVALLERVREALVGAIRPLAIDARTRRVFEVAT